MIGVKGSLATTLPSKMELNMERSEVKAKPMANMDFIFTIIWGSIDKISNNNLCGYLH